MYGSLPTTQLSWPGRHVEEVAGLHHALLAVVHLHGRAAADTSPTCSTMHEDAPAGFPTCSDHFQPGS